MQSELHRNNVYQSVQLLLLVPMLFLLAIPKCLLIFKENSYYTSIFRNMPDKNGYSHPNVLGRFGENSQTAAAKNN